MKQSSTQGLLKQTGPHLLQPGEASACHQECAAGGEIGVVVARGRFFMAIGFDFFYLFRHFANHGYDETTLFRYLQRWEKAKSQAEQIRDANELFIFRVQNPRAQNLMTGSCEVVFQSSALPGGMCAAREQPVAREPLNKRVNRACT